MSKYFRVRDKITGEWVSGMGRDEALTSPDIEEALTFEAAREAWEGYLNFETIDRPVPEVDQNYPGFCCQGFDYEIRLIFPPGKNDPVEYTSIWGSCQNPNCPVHCVEPPEMDMYRGVSQYLLDDFEDILEKKGVNLAPQPANRQPLTSGQPPAL